MQAASPLEYKVGDQPVPGYTLVRELGRGAMGVVWLARTDSGFEAAIKIIDLLKGGGKKEYRGLRTIKHRRIRHGNLLTLFDYWLKDRNGQLIPDSDDLDSTDSFFAPLRTPETGSRPMSATTPQSLSATEAGPQGSKAFARPTSLPNEMRHAGTLVSSGTVVDASRAPPPNVDLQATLDPAPNQRGPGARPVQLIVAMELGDSTLDVRQKACQEDGKPGVPVDELLPYMEQAARGLDYLHREGIVHRDVKPQNIMLVGDVAKVCDYGLIVTTDADLKATSNAFTPLYASPEAVADKPVTGQSDQYSLAVTYIELRTGRSPYSSETAASVYAAKETGKYDLTRVKKSPAKNVLKRALSSSPNERYGSCSDFIRQLEKAEHVRPGMTWALVTVAGLLVGALGAALLVPGVRNTALALINPVEKGRPDNDVPPDPNGGKKKSAPPPVTPPDLKRVLLDAREARVAGDFAKAKAELDMANEGSHWAVALERLHLDISQGIAGGQSVPAERWSDWQARAAALSQQSRGEGNEQAQLAALQILLATRSDGSRLSFDLPLAEDFAAVVSGKSRWGAVLSDGEQKKLDGLYHALCQLVVHHQEALPAAWRNWFKEIWPEPTGSLLLITRVRERNQEDNEAALLVAERDLEEIAEEAGLDATPAHDDLDETRRLITLAKDKFLTRQLTAQLANDEMLTSATVRKQLVDDLNSRATGSKHPLAQLVRLEAEMADHDAAGRRYPSRVYDEVRELIAGLLATPENTPQAWLDHARFLFARVQASLRRGDLFSPQAAGTPEANMLLQWPQPPGSWRTPLRTQQAAEVLVRLAESALPPEKDSVFALFDLRKDQLAGPLRYVEKAEELSPHSPACQGVSATLAAVANAPEGDWTSVLEKAERALSNPASASDPVFVARRPFVEFVAAYAASRAKNASPVAQSKSLTRFASLIKQQFKDEDPARPADEALYNHLVVPGLAMAGATAPADNESRAALAALWAAKARLLERDDSSARVGPRQGNEPIDGYERTILAANGAYAKARELQEDMVSSGGYGRTLLKLSRKSFNANRQQHFEALRAIVERYDADGSSANASLRLIQGWVHWQQAVTSNSASEQRQHVADSLRHYRAVGEITAGNDPYSLHSLALTLASNAHVQAAFWTPVGQRDLAAEAPPAPGTNPLDMSKTEHLLEAVSLAQSAELDEERRIPEEALISQGNGLEDLAYYCKRIENYPLAVKAFESAAGRTALRSKVYALLSRGRCEYRWSRDPADVDATREVRQSRLRQAYQTLKSAVEAAGAEDSRDAAEANWWMAQLLAEAGYSGPGTLEGSGSGGLELESLDRLRAVFDRQDSRQAAARAELTLRLRNFERAWQQAIAAAEMAATTAPQDSITYQVDALEIGSELATLLKKYGALLPDTKRDAVLAKVRKGATDFLETVEQGSRPVLRSMALRVLYVLAQSNYGIPALPDEQDLAVVTLKKYEKLFSGADDRDKLVDLLLWEAAFGGGEEPLNRAEMIAPEITGEEARDRAIGRCLRARADFRLTAIDKAIAAYKAAQAAGRQATRPTVNLKDVAEGYVEAEKSLATAAGSDVAANLNKLKNEPLANLPARFERTLSNLEAYRLRSFLQETSVMRRDAIQAVRGWMSLADTEKELAEGKRNTKFPAAAEPIARVLHDLLKSRALLRDGGLTPDDRVLLEIVEHKLAL